MEIITDQKYLEKLTQHFGVAIGNFDGFHLGHQKLLENFVNSCKKQGILSVVMSFEPHPSIYLGNISSDYLLNSKENKKKQLESVGVDILLELPFDDEIRELSAKEFIKEYLLSNNNISYLHLGHDFKLGKGKEDAFNLIENIKKDVKVHKEEPFKLNNEIVSSTKIREYLKKNLSLANKMLGAPYRLEGVVVSGKGIGKKKLYPTANIKIDEIRKIPSLGVYITKTIIEGESYESVTNIGLNPTISEGNKLTIESYLLFSFGNFYEKFAQVEFLEKIRDEKKFDSIELLRTQISKDVEKSKNYFRKKSSIKLALIGRDIQHSKSQVVYEKLLQRAVDYDLLDYESQSEIPSAENLLEKYDGISITAPYKTHFEKYAQNSYSMVNTLYKKDQGVMATNTDATAVEKIITEYLAMGKNSFIILGDGSMSKLLTQILKKKNLKFMVLSRKEKNLDQIDQKIKNNLNNLVVVNTCSRTYTYTGLKNLAYEFWDMNYGLEKHSEYFKNTGVTYTDGSELLELQAKYALNYWNLN